MLTREELIKIGVNPDNMTYPRGEMNIIVQCFGYEHGIFINEDGEEVVIDNEHPVTEVHPDIYQPRKNCVWSCACQDDFCSIKTKEDKKDWCAHLRDSAERLKIMAYYLSKQADEIEEFGYPKTTCYYPE